MAALTTSVILADIAYLRQDRIFAHLFLGGVVTALFYGLCQNGYEIVNWGVLLIIPVYMLLAWLITIPWAYNNNDRNDKQECPVCSRRSCDCECSYKNRKYEEESYKKLSACTAKYRI
jgi:hypothetical protein